MILETTKSLLIRSKKHKVPTKVTQPPFSAIEKSDSSTDTAQAAPPPQNGTGAKASNAPDPGTLPLSAGNETTHTLRSLPTEQRAPTMSASGLFPYAHDCVININTFNSGETVLQILARKSISGAEAHSSARDPPPKCHPDTRKSLRGRIIDWSNGSKQHWRMLWILGPMGVGKSAVAQTIAGEFNASGRLGAALFFSRPNYRDDPEGVIPTFVYQMAAKYPEYKHIITQRLADDATIMEKNRRIQFKELIIEPFQILMTQNDPMVREPLLIILDGLDECKSKKAQCEFIELISDHVRQVEKFPLLWMICSRPEWHLKRLLLQADFLLTCQRVEIDIDDDEAQQDVASVLENGFQGIREQFYDRLDASWPPGAYIRRISVIASGHFAIASTILKFVGDEHRANPRSQLDICVRFLGGSGIPGAVNPLHALDILYRRIISDVPGDVLPTTLRILGLAVLYPDRRLTAIAQANFLGLDQATFCHSLQYLHSVLEVPAETGVFQGYLHFYHASFADYLLNKFRSGAFSINESAVHYDVAVNSLMWQRHNISAGAQEDPRLQWVPNEGETDILLTRLWDFSAGSGWMACCQVSDEDVPRVVAELEHFNFDELGRVHSFLDFIFWLYKLGDRNNSLLFLETPTDAAVRNDETLPTRHYTISAESLSTFGLDHSGVGAGYTVRLRVGRPNRVLSVEMTVGDS